MRTSTTFQAVTAVLLLATCATVAVVGMPRPPSVTNDDVEKRSAITQEVASAVAIAIDTSAVDGLSETVGALRRRYPELIGVEVLPEGGATPLRYGLTGVPDVAAPKSLNQVHRISLVRGGRPWGTVRVVFVATAAGAPSRGGLPWGTVALAVIVLPLAIVLVERVRRRLDRSPSGPMAVAAERAQHTLDTLAEGVLLLDGRRRIIFANQAFCEGVGAVQSSVVGKPIGDLAWVAPPDSQDVSPSPWVEVFETGRPVRASRVGLRRSESTVTFIANCTPLFRKPGSLHGVLVTLDDVTELEEARLTVQKARDAAQHANEAKSRFLAIMSHEIRTPLNGVCGTLQLLKKTRLEQSQSQYIDAASFSASTLLHLINDVLDLSKIEAGQLELSPIDFELEECVDHTMLMMAQPARAKDIVLAYDFDHAVAKWFKGDPDRIRQIIINLVNNAIKFTERGAVTLAVTVDHDSSERQLLRFAVADTGIGIPENKLHRLFKAFSQVDSSTSRKYGGTGLGLVISKQLCEAMGGTIEVSSAVGAGTTFTFTLNLPKAASPGSDATLSALPARPALAVLVGLHDFEVRRVQAALGLSKDEVLAVPDAEALAPLVERDSRWARGDDTMILVGGADSARDSQIRVAREILSHDSIRTVSASFSHDKVLPGVDPGHSSLQRPIGVRRLLRALLASTNASSATAVDTDGQAEPPQDLRGIRVLLAEDNPVGQMVVADMLREYGAICDTAADGNAVLAALHERTYAIVLMDCFMPELDGFETTKRIRDMQNEGRLPRRLPIIALTAKAMRGDREACIDAGMDDYLTKPVDQQELFRIVARHALGEGEAVSAIEPTKDAKKTSGGDCINTASLQSRYGGKPDILRQLADAFRTVAVQDLEAIRSGIETRDGDQVEHAAHRLAGGAGFVSAEYARQLAQQLERLGAQGTFDGMNELVDELKRQVDGAISTLDHVLRSSPPAEYGAATGGKESVE